MSEALASRVEGPADLPPGAVLAELRAARVTEQSAAARQLILAATWADLHPPESIHDAAVFSVPVGGGEHVEPIAGPGCPAVAEFCVADLGAVLGVSTTAAKKLMGHALELRHRLPRLWASVHAGHVPAWRARGVAEATIHANPALTKDAAGWVDAQVAAVAGKVGPAQLDRLVAEAITRHHLTEKFGVDPDDPDAPWSDDGFGIDRRHVTVDTDHMHYTGTLHLEGDLDLPDALDLDHALSHKAAQYQALGSEESLGARRARALGELARLQTALDLVHPTGPTSPGNLRAADTADTADTGDDPAQAPPVKLPPARQLVLHAHFDATTTTSTSTNADGTNADGTVVFGLTGRLEEGQRLVLLDQVKTWCADTHTHVVIKPVIDLNTRLHTDAYEIPARLREQIVLRDGTCVFPWCTRPARRCQIDHVKPHDANAAAEGRPQPGPTATENLAPLCTRHHRLKTHGRWRYRVTGPGTYHWTSPRGHTYGRDPTGTTPLSNPADPPPRTTPPGDEQPPDAAPTNAAPVRDANDPPRPPDKPAPRRRPRP